MCIGMFFIAVKDLPRVPEPLSRIIETPPTEIYAATGERVMVIGGREGQVALVNPDSKSVLWEVDIGPAEAIIGLMG